MSDTATPAPAEVAAETKPPEAQPDPFAEVLKKQPLKFKSNGKEHTIDSPDVLIRRLQQMDGIEKARADALEQRTAAEKLRAELDAMKSDPLAAFAKLYGDEGKARETVEKALWERIQREERMKSMTPEQRAREEAFAKQEAELAAYRAKEAEAKKAQEAEQQAKVQAEVTDALSHGVMETLTALDAPQELAPIMVRLVAPALATALDEGLSFEAAQAEAMEVGKDFLRRALASQLKRGPEALKWLGEDGDAFVRAVRKADIEAWRSQGSRPAPKSAPVETPKSESPRGRWDDIDKLFGG